MASFSVFWYGCIIFIICIVNAYVMSFFGGGFIDSIMSPDITSRLPGQNSSFVQHEEASGNIWFFVNFFYFIMYFWPVLGGIIFGQSILKKGGNSQYTQGGRYG